MKKFTFGYIQHNPVVLERYLKKSLQGINSDLYDIITTDDTNVPSVNYNAILEQCKTEYLILTHEDVSFPSDLLECIENTIKLVPDFGVLGMVGVDTNRTYKWSNKNEIYEVDTLDCCFIILKTNTDIKFDEINFNEYHLYVEDICAQMNRVHNKKNYTILINSSEILDNKYVDTYIPTKLVHHSATLSKRGAAWGNYISYKNILIKKWGDIKTT
jgi:hypothetical protein